MGFGVVLRHLVGGQAVCGDDALLAGGEGAAVGAVVLDALDVCLEISEDGDLAGEAVGGVRAFDLGLDAVDGRQVVGVVGTGRLCEHAAACEAQESREEDEAGMQ